MDNQIYPLKLSNENRPRLSILSVQMQKAMETLGRATEYQIPAALKVSSRKIKDRSMAKFIIDNGRTIFLSCSPTSFET